MTTHYEVLEVSQTATEAEIKAAYRRLALEHHPDLNQGEGEWRKEKFLAVRTAYEVSYTLSLASRDRMRGQVLVNRRSRGLYDLQLLRERSVPRSGASGHHTDGSHFYPHFHKRAENYSRENAEAWEAEKKAAKAQKVRAERRHRRTTEARHVRGARQLRRFWQSHSGVTWQDALFALCCVSVGCLLWVVGQNPSKLKLKAKDS